MSGDGATRTLARFVAESRYEQLPEPIVAAARLLLIDIVGVAIAGWSTQVGRIPAKTKLAMGGVAESTVIGTAARLPRTAAAHANVSLGVALEADDTLFFLGHHGPGVVLPALAVAEAEGRDGRSLLAAIATGYEISGRIARSTVHVSREADGSLARSAVVGTNYGAIAAAAASSSLLGLDPDRTASAIGIAAYHSTIPTSGRSPPPPRRHMKYNAYAAMAESGVFASLLAAQHFSGDDAILDGDPDGDWFAMSGALPPLRELLVDGLGESWLIGSLSWKRYPCCRFTHGAIDLVVKIMADNGLTAEDIEHIETQVSGHNFAMKMDDIRVDSEVDAQFSLPFAVALAALGITPGPDWMDPALWTDPRVAAMVAKVRMLHWPEADKIMLDGKISGADYRRPARVTLRARGRSFEAATDYFSGDPWSEATRLTTDDIIAKFHDYAAAVPAEARSRFIDAALRAETLPSVGTLLEGLVVPPR